MSNRKPTLEQAQAAARRIIRGDASENDVDAVNAFLFGNIEGDRRDAKPAT